MALLDAVTEPLFGSTDAPRNLFLNSRLGRDLQRFLREQLRTPALDDPRLVRFLDAAISQVDRQFEAAEREFESTRKRRDAGDVIKFQRDLAIARSQARAEIATNLITGFEQARTSGVFPFLQGAQGAAANIAQFLQQDRFGNIAALNQTIQSLTGVKTAFSGQG